LEKGTREGVFPGAVLLVAHHGQVVFFQETGNLSLIPKPAGMRKDTIFDLASLTKPLATTLALMKLVDDGNIQLDQPLSKLLTVPLPSDKKDLTPRLLLSHTAGFTDWKPFYSELEKFGIHERKGRLREWLMNTPLSYAPGEGCLYSDIGFMVLEWIVEERSGTPLPLFLERTFYGPLGLTTIFFSGRTPPAHIKNDRFAATEACAWRGGIMQGIVHDENAYALGGYSGHAGLFGTAMETFTLVNLLRTHFLGARRDYLHPETVKIFFTRQDRVKGCTRTLGWDTPSLQGSSSGRYFSSNSVGHLGFTGTSLWMDLESDVIVILLTNRVHPDRRNEKIRTFRPKIHDCIMETLGTR
jgi:CubicO group peptidase (beta-lactamase class C family)